MGQITMDDLLSQETRRDPIAFYAHVREQGPLTYVANFDGVKGAWIATDYNDVIAILKDPRFLKDHQNLLPPGQQKPLRWRRDMLVADPPDHTRLRGLTSLPVTFDTAM